MALLVCLRWGGYVTQPSCSEAQRLITQERLWYCIPESYPRTWKSEPREPTCPTLSLSLPLQRAPKVS